MCSEPKIFWFLKIFGSSNFQVIEFQLNIFWLNTKSSKNICNLFSGPVCFMLIRQSSFIYPLHSRQILTSCIIVSVDNVDIFVFNLQIMQKVDILVVRELSSCHSFNCRVHIVGYFELLTHFLAGYIQRSDEKFFRLIAPTATADAAFCQLF